VDVIGLSILSGTHLSLCKELMDKMEQEKAQDTFILVGGIILKKDVSRLKELGIAHIFRPSSRMDEIVNFIQSAISQKMVQ